MGYPMNFSNIMNGSQKDNLASLFFSGSQLLQKPKTTAIQEIIGGSAFRISGMEEYNKERRMMVYTQAFILFFFVWSLPVAPKIYEKNKVHP